MRWTPRGAHLLAQVRCAVLNGDAAEKLRAFEAANAYRVDPEVEQLLGDDPPSDGGTPDSVGL